MITFTIVSYYWLIFGRLYFYVGKAMLILCKFKLNFLIADIKTMLKQIDYFLDANVCKNDRCNNLGVRDAAEYKSPSYHLGFPAIYCAKCGSNSLLLNNHDINMIFNSNIHLYLTEIKRYCSKCYSPDIIHYGHTQQKTPRFKCKACLSIYSNPQLTDKHKHKLILLSEALFSQYDFKQIITKLNINYKQLYPLLKQLAYQCKRNKLRIESDLLKKETYHIATHSNIFIARGNPYPIELWGLTSSLSDSGYILLNKLNFTEQNISQDSLYDGQTPIVLNQFLLPAISEVLEKSNQFLQRKSFDQLSYHQHFFSNKNKEKIIEPVVSAYVHFYELEQYYRTNQIYHYLEHEVVLRSAAITSFSRFVRNKTCNIMYLCESNSTSQPQILIINKHIIGWWENEWYELKDRTEMTQRLLGILTQREKIISEAELINLPASFSGIHTFHQKFHSYFPAKRLFKLSPSTIQLLLTIFISFYNFCLISHNGKTPAQHAGLISRQLTFEEFINI